MDPILFTAFEPSGDDHASSVIAELRRRYPELPIAAWGGPKMERAGATLVERTGDEAVMGLPGLATIRAHRAMNKRIGAWIKGNRPALHVPVDSPAANFPICRLAKRSGAKVVHLVAPQIWAWGGWRIRKLRRLTDHVLCLLPFEEEWFGSRQIHATFIGHPLFGESLDEGDLDRRAGELSDGSPRLALMPGSRPGEWAKNFPLLLAAFRDLRAREEGCVGVVAATTDEVADRLRTMATEHGGWPDGLAMVAGDTDAVVRWCSLALVVSGTVTLQIARQRRPMVVFYRSNPLLYALLGRWLLSTEFLSLPNLLAGSEIVPELVPHFEDHKPIVKAALELIDHPALATQQSEALDAVCAQFDGHHAPTAAADAIEKLLGLTEA